MPEYDNTNRGGLWKNNRKEKDTHPDAKGDINVVCPHCQKDADHWLSGWKPKPGANPNSPLLSLSVQPKEEQGYTKQGQSDHAAAAAGDEDIPF